MDVKQFREILRNKKQTVAAIVMVFLAISVIFTALQTFKYGAESKLLIVQNFEGNIDPYSMSKSNEYLSNTLTRVVSSHSFYKKVINSGFDIDRSYFEKKNLKDELEKWEKTVKTKPFLGSGIMEIKVYHPDRAQLEQISLAVNYILKTEHGYYHSKGDNVEIKTLDTPVVSSWPVKPNAFLNLGIGLIFGLAIALSYVYFFPNRKYDLYVWPSRKRGGFQTVREAGEKYGRFFNNQKENWKERGFGGKNKKDFKGNNLPISEEEGGSGTEKEENKIDSRSTLEEENFAERKERGRGIAQEEESRSKEQKEPEGDMRNIFRE
ncbi:MAG: YveK family protein [Patescibacteria group bacterium]